MIPRRGIDEKEERTGIAIGVVMTGVLHVCAAILVSFSGLKYLYPPPMEQSMLIDFEEYEVEMREQTYGREPQANEVNPNEAVNLVQRSTSPEVARRENLTPYTNPDNFGDVDVPTIESQEPALDPRASFPGMAQKDTTLTAMHAAAESSPTFTAGQADGNTRSGRTTGKPNAQVKGRNIIGNIPRPAYNVQEEGTVVVNVVVDNYGKVVRAVVGDGTTVNNSTLHAAARKAAMETHFNMSADAPVMQEGTITYYFKLK